MSRQEGHPPLGRVFANTTPDKPTVTFQLHEFCVADVQACYKRWKSREAEFIAEPIPKYGEIRCYICDANGYIIEVGQGRDLTYG